MAATRFPKFNQDRNRGVPNHPVKLSIGHSLKNGPHDDVDRANSGCRIWATIWANN